MQRIGLKIIAMLTIIIALVACSNKDQLLNPDKPITIDLWHYYNGTIKEEFDALVSEFNETVGTNRGIIVETQSYGEITQLETALLEAANQSIGALPMPDVFAAYSDHAYQIAQLIHLVPLDDYFSEEELATYREEFLTVGQFFNDGKSYILPVAKSTENLFVNKTDWEIFANNYGFSDDDLQTWEGISNVAEKYYEATGKAFFSHDSNANFMILFSKQLDTDLFSIQENGKGTFVLTEDIAKQIWEQFYIPHMKGYYKKTGRFSPDDAKVGAVLAFTSSTAGASYFPKDVTIAQNTHAIEPLVLPYPYVDPTRRYAVQQGAGMSIAQNGEAYEYGASVFLKWFTEIEQNMKFSIKSGYLPVKNEAYENDLLLAFLDDYEISNAAIRDSLITANQMFKDYTLYSSKPFVNSAQVRRVIDNYLYEEVLRNLDILEVRMNNGENPKDILEEMISDDQFYQWFTAFKEEIENTLQ